MPKKLTYEQFIDMIRKRLIEEYAVTEEQIKYYAKGTTSDDAKMQEWIRDCNQLYNGEASEALLNDFLIVETPEDENITGVSRIAIEKLYQDYLEKGMDYAYEIVRGGQADLEKSRGNHEALRTRAQGDYEAMKEQLIIRPLNYGLHMRELKGCVYQKFSDFAFVLYQLVSDEGDSLISSKIKREELEQWGCADREEEVMKEAMANTMRRFPPVVYDYRIRQEVNFLEADVTRKDIMMQAGLAGNHILLSTSKCTNGAVALFYPGVVEKMMQVMGGPFNAVLMNTNDILIFDLRERNVTSFAKQAGQSGKMGEMLSSKVYHCDENGINPATQFVTRL